MFFKSLLSVCVMCILSATSCVAAEESATSTGPPVAESAFAKAFGTTGDTISSSMGGDRDLFVDAAEEVLRTGRHIKIDGPCKSSCVIFADKARPNICITANVVFSFHMGIDLTTGERLPMPLSADIEAYVLKYGGLPYKGYLYMDAKQASSFWPMCK